MTPLNLDVRFTPESGHPLDGLACLLSVMTILVMVAVVALCLNVVGSLINPGPAPLAIATVYVLSYATVAFIGTYSLFLRD